MPTGDLTALSDDDDAPVLPAALGGRSDPQPKVAAKKAAAKAKAAAAKPAAAKMSENGKEKPDPKAKSEANPKAKSKANPKAKSKANPKTKSKSSKEQDKQPTKSEEEEACSVDEPAPWKKPAANVKKRPAANPKSDEPEIRAYKYQYHDKKKWGIRIKGGSELMTVKPSENVTDEQQMDIAEACRREAERGMKKEDLVKLADIMMAEARKANLENKQAGQGSASDTPIVVPPADSDAAADLKGDEEEGGDDNDQEGEEEDADPDDDAILDAD